MAAAGSPASLTSPAAAFVGRDDAISVLEGVRARRDDARAVVETLGNLDRLAVADADLDRDELGGQHVLAAASAARAFRFLGRRGNEHARPPGEIDEGVARHGDGVAARADRELHARIHARLEPVADVGDFDFDFSRARGRVEDRGHTAHTSLERFSRVRVYFHVGRRAHGHASHVALDQVRHHPHRADVDDRRHRCIRARKRAGVEVTLADEAVDRGHDLRVGEGDLQLLEPGLGGFELGLGELELRHGRLLPRVDVVEGLLRQQLPLVEAAGTIEIVLRQLEVRLALANGGLRDRVGGFRAANLLADFAVLDAGDDLSLPDRVAELDVDDLQPAVGARDNLDRGRANQVADDEDLLGHRRPLGRRELDRHRRPGAAPTAGGRTAARCRAAAVVEQYPSEADDGHDYDRDRSAHWTLKNCVLLLADV